VNTDLCAEGISPADEYRITQRRPKPGADEPRQYLDVPPDSRFRLVRRFGLFDVFRRS
jgi:hypothetical protein